MMRIPRALVRKWVEQLLHIHDSPKRTAAAFALGVFFGFSPFLGLHTVLGIIFAFVFNLNRVAVLVGVYSNLPWIIGAWYAVTTAAGAWVLGTHLPPDFGARFRALFELSLFQPGFWDQLAFLMRPLVWPCVVGSTIGALLLALIAYWLTFGFLEARHRHHLHHLHPRADAERKH
jgi:uncharacterized protein (DUF2062 family)